MNPVTVHRIVDFAYPHRLRGDNNSQNNTAMLYQNPTQLRPGDTTATAMEGIALSSFSLHNRGGGAQSAMGIGFRIPNRYWGAGQWTDSGSVFTDDTTAAQDTTATDFPLETTTNSDGFVVHSRVRFNAISIDVGTASVDATDPARAVRYSNAAGTGWTDFANMFVQDGAASEYTATENIICWAPPVDWGVVVSLSTIPVGHYAVNVRATTAPDTTAGVADSLSIYRIYYLTENVADNGTLEVNFGPLEIWQPEGDALVALFNTANNQNRVTAAVRYRT